MEERSDIRPQEERSILINFVLDKSGSMEIIREATSRWVQPVPGRSAGGGWLRRHDPHPVRHALQDPGHGSAGGRGEASGPAELHPGRQHRALRRDRPHPAAHRPVRGGAQARPGAVRHHDRRPGERQPRVQPAPDHAARSSTASSRPTTSSSTWAPTRIRTGWAPAWASPTAARSTTRLRRLPPRPPWSRLSLNVKAHRRGGEKRSSQAFFSPELEDLGRGSYDDYKAKRDRDAAGDAAPEEAQK